MADYEEEEEVAPHPVIQTEDEDGDSPPIERKASKARRGSFHSKASRSASAVEWADDDREAEHLREQNIKLKQKIKNMKQTIRQIRTNEGGEMSAADEASAEELRAQNEQYEADIEKYREKARQVNDIALLDTLMDDLQEKEMQVKALELQRRQIADNRRNNTKLLKAAGDAPSRQKVFLELKDERRRQQRRIDQAQERKEKLAEQIQLIQERAQALEAEVEENGIADFDVPAIINLQKKDEEQKKQIEKLQQQIGICNSSFDALKTKTGWMDRDKQLVIDELKKELERVNAQVAAKEQLILSNNQALKEEKPPHHVPSLNSSRSPRNKPPSEPTSPKSDEAPKPKEEKKKKAPPEPPAKKAPKKTPKPPATKKPSSEEASPRGGSADKPAPSPSPPQEEEPEQAPPPPKEDQEDEKMNDPEEDRYSDDAEASSAKKKEDEEPAFLTE